MRTHAFTCKTIPALVSQYARAFVFGNLFDLLISCLSFVEVSHSVTWGERVILPAKIICPGHWYICKHQHARAKNEIT